MLHIYVPIYNSAFCAEYQLKTLKTFVQDKDYRIIIVDQNFGRHPKSSAHIKKLCSPFPNVGYVENKDRIASHYQDQVEQQNNPGLIPYKIGATYNMCYRHARDNGVEYLGFLDQDCFLFKPTNISDILKKKRAYGKVVPTHPDSFHKKLQDGSLVKDVYGQEHLWNLHCIVNFYETNFLRGYESSDPAHPTINFMPGSWGPGLQPDPNKGVLLDTGGANWFSVWRHHKPEEFAMEEDHYYYYDDLSLLNPNDNKPTNTLYEVHDNRWVHMVHGGVNKSDNEVLNPKFSYIKGFLDFAMMNVGSEHRKTTGFRSIHDPRPPHPNEVHSCSSSQKQGGLSGILAKFGETKY